MKLRSRSRRLPRAISTALYLRCVWTLGTFWDAARVQGPSDSFLILLCTAHFSRVRHKTTHHTWVVPAPSAYSTYILSTSLALMVIPTGSQTTQSIDVLMLPVSADRPSNTPHTSLALRRSRHPHSGCGPTPSADVILADPERIRTLRKARRLRRPSRLLAEGRTIH